MTRIKIIVRFLDASKVLSHLEPSGLYWSNETQHVLSLLTLAPSLRDVAILEPGAVAATAEHRKRSKNLHVNATHHFIPIAVQSLGVLGEDARSFFRNLAKRLEVVNEDRRSHQFLLQRVAVAVQRGNAASVLGSIASKI